MGNYGIQAFPVFQHEVLKDVEHPMDRLALAVVAQAVWDKDVIWLQTTGREMIETIVGEVAINWDELSFEGQEN